MSLTVGSLFAGYGGIDLGLSMILDAQPAWFVEFHKHPSAVLAKRFPGVPNHGDITRVDWSQVEPVDIICGGYPCQPFSHAGNRKGTNDERHLWPYVKTALRLLRPRLAVFENVAGHLSLGFDTVLADLAEIGFDAEWVVVRASDAGAPHRRERVFIVAAPHATDDRREWTGGAWSGRPGLTDDSDDAVALLPTPAVNDMGAGKTVEWWDEWAARQKAADGRPAPHGKSLAIEAQRLLPTPRATDGDKGGPNQTNGRGGRDSLPGVVPLLPTIRATRGGSSTEISYALGGEYSDDTRPQGVVSPGTDFGPYTAAIARWEAVLGRAAPSPTEPNRDGRPRLSPRFVEFMMGLPDGWVTDAGIPRNAQLKALGNGVVPRQCALALSILIPRLEQRDLPRSSEESEESELSA